MMRDPRRAPQGWAQSKVDGHKGRGRWSQPRPSGVPQYAQQNALMGPQRDSQYQSGDPTPAHDFRAELEGFKRYMMMQKQSALLR